MSKLLPCLHPEWLGRDPSCDEAAKPVVDLGFRGDCVGLHRAVVVVNPGVVGIDRGPCELDALQHFRVPVEACKDELVTTADHIEVENVNQHPMSMGHCS